MYVKCSRWDGSLVAEKLRRSKVGLFRLRDCFEMVAGLLRQGNGKVPQTVPSDWDAERQRPVPDSVAWKY